MARINRKGIRHQSNFTLKQYKTWEAAERAAELWVKGMLKTLPPPESSKNRFTRRNNSGVVGVHLTCSTNKRPNDKVYSYWAWVARWPNSPMQGGLGWSVNKYGDNNAFALAVLARRHEIVDRDLLLSELKRIKNTKEYAEILSIKKKHAP